MKPKRTAALAAVAFGMWGVLAVEAMGGQGGPFMILKPDDFKADLADDADWLAANVPLLDCPDPNIREVYYFRWRVFHKHIQQTPDGYIVSEFLPKVGWSGKHNSISCAAGHHFYEGRWLRERKYLDDYAVFWFRKGGEPRRYSFWAADAIYARYLADGRAEIVKDLLPDLAANYEAWEKSRLGPNGLFWQIDDRDGMEMSIGGSGYRPTINSYLYGDAVAIAKIAELAGKADLARAYRAKAARLKELVQTKLWDEQAKFFKTLPRKGDGLVDVREEVGFVPWYFNLPDAGHEVAWKQLMDEQGFYAPFGPTTAERRHPRFMFKHPHDCLWNGPSWPYATTQTLVAMANLLNNYRQDAVGPADYLKVLTNYARSQYKDGRPWIAENLDGLTGKWIVDKPRSVDYNHSGFCDLVITGLAGLRPRADDTLQVRPLVPPGAWEYFCLDGAAYHGRSITILYDKTGKRYGKGAGLRVFADGKQVAQADDLGGPVTAGLPPAAPKAAADASSAPAAGGWVKYAGNPVLGGKLGTCFDVALLKEGPTFRMWFSWRPRKSIALVESADGIGWSEPVIVLGPEKSTRWEDDMNRPAVVKRDDGYHMWYTGQAGGRSRIGYATSPDGRTWKRMSDQPVLSPAGAWEKVAVMCPHVVWDAKAGLFRMWYSGGDQYEPNAIGYATSPDGKTWKRHPGNPVFTADPASPWEKHKVTAAQIIPRGEWHYMFYIGFADEHHARIGLARSRDGVTGWQRHPANPILQPSRDEWDHDATYKPFAILDAGRWMLWYNGRRGGMEQIGLALHEGEDLGF